MNNVLNIQSKLVYVYCIIYKKIYYWSFDEEMWNQLIFMDKQNIIKLIKDLQMKSSILNDPNQLE